MTPEQRTEYEKLADELNFTGNISAWKDETLQRKVDDALNAKLMVDEMEESEPIETGRFEDKTFINTSNHPLRIGLQRVLHGKEFALMAQEKTKDNIKVLHRLYGWGWIKES